MNVLACFKFKPRGKQHNMLLFRIIIRSAFSNFIGCWSGNSSRAFHCRSIETQQYALKTKPVYLLFLWTRYNHLHIVFYSTLPHFPLSFVYYTICTLFTRIMHMLCVEVFNFAWCQQRCRSGKKPYVYLQTGIRILGQCTTNSSSCCIRTPNLKIRVWFFDIDSVFDKFY